MTESASTRVFGGRYEIQHKIARGGMADVFYARDNLLDRPVALKVLFPELSVDPSFVERFRREAQSAARLSHPNIVSVYDWGEDEKTYYIVMELIEGKSLSQMLREQKRLPVEKAAVIGAEVASALSFAHRNGVVHRDVKPGNVLIDGRGSVKVTDFGIARARNSTENLTQTGAVMGTATYFSPEQAQGLSVDPRSDVYSLGVVLYEMVAGRPPFAGDNPVTIAYKHVRETPEPLRSIDPSIPVAYQTIVGQALTKAPANRYNSADDLRADLERFRQGQPVQATGMVGADAGATQAVPAYRSAQQVYADSTRTIPSAGPVATSREPAPANRRGIAGPLVMFGILIAAIVLGVVLFLSGAFGNGSNSPTPVTIPNVVGKTQADAQSTLEGAKLDVSVSTEANNQTRGIVIRQDPQANAQGQTGQLVTIVVSSGPGAQDVPNLIGKTEDQARTLLTQAGFAVSKTEAPDDSRAKGTVIAQSPDAGSSLDRGKSVSITVSTGKEAREIPNVEDFNQSGAERQLTSQGFQTQVVEQASDKPEGVVIGTNPAAGTSVEKGSLVTIFVSTGQSSTTTTSSTTSTTEP